MVRLNHKIKYFCSANVCIVHYSYIAHIYVAIIHQMEKVIAFMQTLISIIVFCVGGSKGLTVLYMP